MQTNSTFPQPLFQQKTIIPPVQASLCAQTMLHLPILQGQIHHL